MVPVTLLSGFLGAGCFRFESSSYCHFCFPTPIHGSTENSLQSEEN